MSHILVEPNQCYPEHLRQTKLSWKMKPIPVCWFNKNTNLIDVEWILDNYENTQNITSYLDQKPIHLIDSCILHAINHCICSAPFQMKLFQLCILCYAFQFFSYSPRKSFYEARFLRHYSSWNVVPTRYKCWNNMFNEFKLQKTLWISFLPWIVPILLKWFHFQYQLRLISQVLRDW